MSGRQVPHKFTEAQRAQVLSMRGRRSVTDIARIVGVSKARIYTLGRELGVSFRSQRIDGKLIEGLCATYLKSGRQAALNAFPGHNSRYILDKYADLNGGRWCEEALVAAARMAGILSWSAQAKHVGFKKTSARGNSVEQLWRRRGIAGITLHGMLPTHADVVLTKGYPTVQVQLASGKAMAYTGATRRPLCLWCDAVDHLKPDMPDFLADGISALAQFQAWLYAPEHPKKAILSMLDAA